MRVENIVCVALVRILPLMTTAGITECTRPGTESAYSLIMPGHFKVRCHVMENCFRSGFGLFRSELQVAVPSFVHRFLSMLSNIELQLSCLNSKPFSNAPSLQFVLHWKSTGIFLRSQFWSGTLDPTNIFLCARSPFHSTEHPRPIPELL